jgi:hypothetical protein
MRLLQETFVHSAAPDADAAICYTEKLRIHLFINEDLHDL